MATNIDLGHYEGIAWLVGETDDCTVAYAKGNLARLIASLGQSIYMVHKESGVPLKEIGDMLNYAVKAAKELDEKGKVSP